MEFNLIELQKQAPKVFNNTFYDGVLQAAKELFPNRVTASPKYGEIVISDRIALTLSLSGNENKIYFDSWISAKVGARDPFTLSCNPTFRVFGLNEALMYLQHKAVENLLIKNIEG